MPPANTATDVLGDVERVGQHGILIVGMPRSGTTWLGKIFDSHPCTFYRHEPDSWQTMDAVPIVPKAVDYERLIPSVQRFYEAIVGMRAAKVCGKAPLFKKAYLSSARHGLLQTGILMSRAAGKLGLEWPVVGVPEQLTDDLYLVWKSIESVGRLPLIIRALPQIRAIHLIRHPCGYIASVLRGESRRQFADNRGTSEDYGMLEMLLDSTTARQRKLSTAHFRQLSPIERLAWQWVLFNDEAHLVSSENARCRTVCYEELCADPVRTARELFTFSELDWASQTEEFVLSSTTQNEGSYYSVFKNPAIAANKWREELSPEDVRRIRDVVQDTTAGRHYAASW